MKFNLLLMLLILPAITFNVMAGSVSLTSSEQQKITDEAENWIDEMPDGLQDRLSDAVLHAMRGFYNEIAYFRNLSDTTDVKTFPVKVEDLNGTGNSDIKIRKYSPQNPRNKKLPLLIYFHGGGWSLGSVFSTEKFCSALAATGNVIVASVSYPLAPEKPFPAALISCEECVEFIFSKSKEWGSDVNLISLGGDGSGGNLALSVYQKLPDKLKVRSMVLYYPLIRTTGSLNVENKRKYGRGYGFDSRLWEAFTEAYKGKEIENEKILPPTLLIGAGRDIIVDQIREFSKDNMVTYIEFQGALHGFITDGHQTTAFKKSVELTSHFLVETKK